MEISYILLAILGANLFVLLLNIVFWLLVSRVDIRVRKRKQQINDEYNNIISDANQSAAEIIEQANNKASKLLEKTEFQVEDLRESARKNYAITQEKHLQQLEVFLKELKVEDRQFFDSLKNSLTKDAKQLSLDSIDKLISQMDGYLQNFGDQLSQTQSKVAEKIENSIEQTNKDIESYKQQQIGKIDKSIINLVKKVALNVLGKTIETTEHQRLILESLDKAKKEGVV